MFLTLLLLVTETIYHSVNIYYFFNKIKQLYRNNLEKNTPPPCDFDGMYLHCN